jgi:ABC-type transporter Mla subunit MlaD
MENENATTSAKKKNYGRKPLPSGAALDQSIKFWVTGTEKQNLEKLAQTAGVSLSQFCRGKIFDAVPLYRANPRELIQMVNKLSAEIHPVGNNINQLARLANAAAKSGAASGPALEEMNRLLSRFTAQQAVIAEAFLKFLRSKK